MSLDALNHVASPSWRLYIRKVGRIQFGLVASWMQVMMWHQRSRQRLHLLSLDDRMLGDVGLTRAQAEAEAAKPFWRD